MFQGKLWKLTQLKTPQLTCISLTTRHIRKISTLIAKEQVGEKKKFPSFVNILNFSSVNWVMKNLTLPSLRWSVSSTDRKVCTRFCLHRVHRCIKCTPAACLSTLDTQPCLFSVGIPQLTGKVNLKKLKELKAAILTPFLDERKWLLSLHAIFRQKF